MTVGFTEISIQGACEHNLKNLDLVIQRGEITLITGVSGSGKSSLAFDTILAEAQRRFFYTLSHYSRQFLDMGSRPKVRKITGLSPAISLAQNETQPSRRASVATLCDAGELLGVLYARFAVPHCPNHDLPTTSLSVDAVTERIVADFAGEQIAVCVPVSENKKGSFSKQLTHFASKGFTRAYIDGAVVGLIPVPDLARDEKHTIKVFVDVVKIKADRLGRLQRSLATALQEGQGYGEYFLAIDANALDLSSGGRFGGGGGCPECGFSWPELDSRYFSANSLGRCTSCNGVGLLGEDVDILSQDDEADSSLDLCMVCQGTGIDPQYNALRIGETSISHLHLASLEEVQATVASWRDSELGKNPAFERVITEVDTVLSRIRDVGLGYLNLARRIRTLSGGEAQRLKLAGILAESLRGILYVLDEPSQGLHPAELDQLWQVLVRLKGLGNTLLIVDHDEHLIRKADWIIDLGPGGGAQGGKLMGKFRPQDAANFAAVSATARALTIPKKRRNREPLSSREPLILRNVRLHNLDLPEVSFPKQALTAVTGVSGAGKSSLVIGVLAKNLSAVAQAKAKRGSKRPALQHCESLAGEGTIETVTCVDRKPIGKSHVSMPATYLDLYKDIRDLFGNLPEAQIAGLSPRDFSVTATGGRCPECRGRGQVNLTMRFLPDARVECPLCEGRRFRPHVLEVKYSGHSIADVLTLTLDEVAAVFKNHRRVLRRLSPALDLGLGYLKLGQPCATLSGGEAQRLKLAPLLARTDNQAHLLVLEEPTAGLHAEDVDKLIGIFHNLVASGATIVTIEHNADVILAADWVIDLGPGAARKGGRLVFQGPPEALRRAKESLTAKYLK